MPVLKMVMEIKYRLSFPYLQCLGSEVFQIFILFWIWNICIYIMRYLAEIRPKSKHKLYLCFIYTIYTHSEGKFYTVFLDCLHFNCNQAHKCRIFYLWCCVGAQKVLDFKASDFFYGCLTSTIQRAYPNFHTHQHCLTLSDPYALANTLNYVAI